MPGEQLSLLGLEPAPRDKLPILVIYPDPPARLAAGAAARRYQEANGLGGAVFSPDRTHVTLGHLEPVDLVPASLIEKVSRAAGKLNIAPFEVSFDRIGGFSQHVVLQGGEGLQALRVFQAALRHALAWEKLDGAKLVFTPHMTVIYGQPGPVVTPIEPVTWTVSEFALVVSLQGKGRHEVLARYRLAG